MHNTNSNNKLGTGLGEETFKKYTHAPAHLFLPGVTYFITGAIYRKQPIIYSSGRKEFWMKTLLAVLGHYRWDLSAWVVLDNHYHLLCRAPKNSAVKLSQWINSLHRRTAKQWNEEEKTAGRQVWWNYWDTCITNERSYYARLNYIYHNPVKHGLASRPDEYSFSSYAAHLNQQPEFIRRILNDHPFDRVKVLDDF